MSDSVACGSLVGANRRGHRPAGFSPRQRQSARAEIRTGRAGIGLRLLVDDHDLALADPAWLRRQIGVVLQESFPLTRFGTLEGRLESVSYDAAVDEQLGAVLPARIHLARASLMIDGRPVRMTAGMRISAEVKTGNRPVIDYLLSPLKRYRAEAGGER